MLFGSETSAHSCCWPYVFVAGQLIFFEIKGLWAAPYCAASSIQATSTSPLSRPTSVLMPETQLPGFSLRKRMMMKSGSDNFEMRHLLR